MRYRPRRVFGGVGCAAQAPARLRFTRMRGCIFCGASPVTKEDAWPVWLIEKVGRSRLIASMTGPNARAPYSTNRIEQRAGCACRECNNGWMSDLERLTKSILGPMVDGSSTQVSGDAQLVLAAWMLKTLMVFDWVIGNEYWRQEEREVMFHRLGAPPGK